MIFQVRPGPIYRPSKPVRDEKYLRYIRLFPCVGCGSTRRIEAAHIGAHSLDSKASDLDACPLCEVCHRTGPGAIHKIGREAFEQARGIVFDTLARMFQRFYCLKNGTQDWWPNKPNLTLQACSVCQHEEFQEEIEITGCSKCGAMPGEERAA